MCKFAYFTRIASLLLLIVLGSILLPSRSALANIPEGFKVFPKPGQVLVQDKPVIKVRYPKNHNLDFASVRLWIKGREVAGNCLRTPNYVSFQPFVEIPAGTIDVRFEGKNAKDRKNITKIEWSFELKSPELITSITHNADHDMGYKEEIIVQAQTIPNANVWFSLEGIADQVMMRESVPGQYEGRYKVKQNDNKLQSHITVYVKSASHYAEKIVKDPIVILGGMFTISISEPKDDELVPLKFKIKGHTRPNATVYMCPKIGLSSSMNTNSKDRNAGSLGSISTTADENGYFEFEYGFPILLPNMQALLMFTASDSENNQAIQKNLWVKFK